MKAFMIKTVNFATRYRHAGAGSGSRLAIRNKLLHPIVRVGAASVTGVDALEVPVHRLERLVQQRPNSPQRMLRRHPALQRHVAEHPALLDIRSTHCASPAITKLFVLSRI